MNYKRLAFALLLLNFLVLSSCRTNPENTSSFSSEEITSITESEVSSDSESTIYEKDEVNSTKIIYKDNYILLIC